MVSVLPPIGLPGVSPTTPVTAGAITDRVTTRITDPVNAGPITDVARFPVELDTIE